jgi:general secretion pathway protein N
VAERTFLKRAEHAGPLTWLLAAIALWAILLWAAALAGMGSRIAPVQGDAGDALPLVKPALPDRIGPLAQYAEAASRPVFTTDRKPHSFMATGPDNGDGAAAAQSLEFVLTGVLISPQVRLAILQPTGGGDSQRVREGKSPEGAAGWRLIEVQPRRVVFEGANGQSTLDLRTFGASATDRDEIARAVPGARPPPPTATAAAAASADAAAAVPPQNEQQRIEAIRKRIEARRAQLRTQQNRPQTPSPSSSLSPPSSSSSSSSE